MGKKTSFAARTSSRNAADIKRIHESPTFKSLVQETEGLLKTDNSGNNNSDVNDEESVNKMINNITDEKPYYKVINREFLVPAPQDWNHFTPLSKEKKMLMVESIYHNGLLQPIVVRELDPEGKTFQILAGHNRSECFEVLHYVTKSDEYLSIPCYVFKYSTIDDVQAKEIVEDTNFVQRGNLSARDKAICIYNKTVTMKKRRKTAGLKGDLMGLVADQFGIARATVFFWKKLINLIPEFDAMFTAGDINLISASKIATFSQKTQLEMYKHKDLITNENLRKLKARTPDEDVVKILVGMKKKFSLNFFTDILSLKEDSKEDSIVLTIKKPDDKIMTKLKELQEYGVISQITIKAEQ